MDSSNIGNVMADVIDFFFEILNDVFDLILSNWILSMSFLIIILGFIVSLIVGTRSDN